MTFPRNPVLPVKRMRLPARLSDTESSGSAMDGIATITSAAPEVKAPARTVPEEQAGCGWPAAARLRDLRAGTEESVPPLTEQGREVEPFATLPGAMGAGMS